MAKIYHLKSAGVAERLSGEQSNVLLKIGNGPTLLRLEINQNPNDAFITLHKVLKGNSTEPTHLKAFPPEKAGELEFTIGRNRETATHIQTGNATVSEFHATIRVDSDSAERAVSIPSDITAVDIPVMQ